MGERTKPVFETGGEPHFHVTEIHYEISADGTVLCSAYEEVRGELRLQYTTIVTGPKLVQMGRAAMDAGAVAHNLRMQSGDETSH